MGNVPRRIPVRIEHRLVQGERHHDDEEGENNCRYGRCSDPGSWQMGLSKFGICTGHSGPIAGSGTAEYSCPHYPGESRIRSASWVQCRVAVTPRRECDAPATNAPSPTLSGHRLYL